MMSDQEFNERMSEFFADPGQPVRSYRCPCCGEDVMDTGPVCTACRDAGCEKTRDAAGEVNYTNCQRQE